MIIEVVTALEMDIVFKAVLLHNPAEYDPEVLSIWARPIRTMKPNLDQSNCGVAIIQDSLRKLIEAKGDASP